MRKLLCVLTALTLAAALFAGCAAGTASAPSDTAADAGQTSGSEKEVVRLATLKGPTTMGLVKLLSDGEADSLAYTVQNEIYGTADEVSALLSSGDIDMAAIPCNLASALFNKTGGAIEAAAVNTLGVLCVVETGDTINSVADLKGRTVYSTGKGTTPEYVFNAILSWNGLDPETDLTVEYKNEATEIAGLLADGGSDAVAVLPQPYATSVLMQNESARIALDLTEEWAKGNSGGALVTGVLAVRRDFAESHKDLLNAFLADYSKSVDWVNANTADAAALIEGYGIVAKAAIAEKALPYCNIVFEQGARMKTDVSSYLAVLFEQNPKAVGGALPDDSFYYGV